MNTSRPLSRSFFTFGLASLALLTAHAADAQPYKVVNTVKVPGSGSTDYVYADNDGRRLYVPRGNQVLVFDLDTLKSVGSVTNARARGATVDSKSHHGFCSSSPVVMWDSQTLERLKTIEVKGRPDAIHLETSTERVFVFSHPQPNATVIDAKNGTVVGTIDLGGEPEQATSDGQGHLYVVLEDKNQVAVVDVKTLAVTAHYDLGGKGGGPTGLAIDTKNRILFAFCRNPATAVVLGADDGKILASIPIGKGTDGGVFNPKTNEAFCSQGDGTLAVIQEKSPTEFVLEQTVKTKARAKTCTMDTKQEQIVLITTENPAPDGSALLDILVVGR